MRKGLVSVFFGLVFSMVAVFGAQAQQADIEGTINQQFEAFKADDFEEAFKFASPSLQLLFRTPDNFRRMVTTGFPMVWRPAEVRYLDLSERGQSMFQRVQVTDEEGKIHLLEYQMIRVDDAWRIASVQFLEAPGVSA
jgi:hypothetical protein